MLWGFVLLFAIFMTINAIICVMLILIWDYCKKSSKIIDNIYEWYEDIDDMDDIDDYDEL